MFYLRLIIFLFVAGSFNVISLLLVHSLPALSGFQQEAMAVALGFLLFADAILLYVMFFRVSDVERHKEFDDILDEVKSGEEASQEEFDRAFRQWKDER
jgi:hypothetical protein